MGHAQRAVSTSNSSLQENRFAKCDICVAIKMERKSCLDKEKQAELRKSHQEHLERVT